MLNKNYFNSIELTSVRGKFYRADEVDSLLADIRSQALAMNKELEDARLALAEYEKKKGELGEALISTRSLCKEIVDGANREADRIIKEANAEKEQLLSSAGRREDELVEQMGAAYAQIKKHHEDSIEEINRQWQNFLSNLTK